MSSTVDMGCGAAFVYPVRRLDEVCKACKAAGSPYLLLPQWRRLLDLCAAMSRRPA